MLFRLDPIAHSKDLGSLFSLKSYSLLVLIVNTVVIILVKQFEFMVVSNEKYQLKIKTFTRNFEVLYRDLVLKTKECMTRLDTLTFCELQHTESPAKKSIAVRIASVDDKARFKRRRLQNFVITEHPSPKDKRQTQ